MSHDVCSANHLTFSTMNLARSASKRSQLEVDHEMNIVHLVGRSVSLQLPMED